MTAIGSIIWWFELILFLLLLVKKIKELINEKNFKPLKTITSFGAFMLLFLIAYISIYVMQYGGSLELRMRGVLYIVSSSFVLSINNLPKLQKKDFIFTLAVVILMLIITSFVAL